MLGLIQALSLSHADSQPKTSGAIFFINDRSLEFRDSDGPDRIPKNSRDFGEFRRDNPSISIDKAYVLKYFSILNCITVKESPFKPDYQYVKDSFSRMCLFDTIVVESDEREKENPFKLGWKRVE